MRFGRKGENGVTGSGGLEKEEMEDTQKAGWWVIGNWKEWIRVYVDGK